MSGDETPGRACGPPRETSPFTVHWTTPSGAAQLLRLEDVRHPLASVAAPSDAEAQAVGSEVELVLEEGELRTEYRGRVLLRVQRDGGDQYTIEITSGSLAERRRLYRLGGVCRAQGAEGESVPENPRRSYRVKVDLEEELVVELRVEGAHLEHEAAGAAHLGAPRLAVEWHWARLHDVSITGIGTIVPLATEALLAEANEVLVRFEPDILGQAFTHPARVRRRQHVQAGVRYGLEFYEEETPDDVLFQEALTQYVMQRQRENLQGKAS